MNLKYLLDEEAFNKIPDGEIIETGEIVDGEGGLNLSRSGRVLRWVAKKGFADDWCVYAHFSDEHSIASVTMHGDKVCDKRNIDNILKVTDEVWAKYRF